jgi:hypothetical protein
MYNMEHLAAFWFWYGMAWIGAGVFSSFLIFILRYHPLDQMLERMLTQA